MKLILRTFAKNVVLKKPFLLRIFRIYAQPKMRTPSRTENMFLKMNFNCDVFVDVGANIGLYSIMMRNHARQILSFEPIPENVRQLEYLKIRNMKVYPLCLGEKSGEVVLRIPSRNGALVTGLATAQTENQLYSQEDQNIEELTVKVMNFDDLWASKKCGSLDLIKIDVEGFEYEVIKGMNAALESERPALLIEIESRHNPDDFEKIFNDLWNLGYKSFYSPDGSSLTALTEPNPERIQSEDEASPNYFNNFFFLQDKHIETYASFISPNEEHVTNAN